jgi:hypothetical protein
MTSNVNESNRPDIAGGKHETVINITSPHLSNMAQRAQSSSDMFGGGSGSGAGGAGGVGGVNNSLSGIGKKGFVEEDDADEHKPVKAPPRGSPLAAVLYILTAVALVTKKGKKKQKKKKKTFCFFA